VSDLELETAEYRWNDDAAPAAAAMAFVSGVDRDERGRPLATLELVDEDEDVLGTAVVSATDLPAWDAGAAEGTSVYHVTVKDGRLVAAEYDADLSEEYHRDMVARIERLADDG
jgi:hypothetical protein